MSWIVQSLWNNREEIKQKSNGHQPREYKNFNFFLNYDLLYLGGESENDNIIQNEEFLREFGYDDPFIESDEFNDLLVIEKAIEELKDLGLLSSEDLDILYDDGSKFRTRNQKYFFDKKYSYVCERIAYYLGGYFTDEGYINYLTRKYKLTPEQQEIARDYMRSKFKNKILRKGYRIEEVNEKNGIISTKVQTQTYS